MITRREHRLTLDLCLTNIQSIEFSSSGELFGFRDRAYLFDLTDGSYGSLGRAGTLDVRGAVFVRAVPGG